MTTGDLSGRRRLVLDSVEGDFLDEEMDDVLRFAERFRRGRFGVVAERGEFEECTGGGSMTIGGTLRAGFASETFRGGTLASFGRLLGALEGAGDDAADAGAAAIGAADAVEGVT